MTSEEARTRTRVRTTVAELGPVSAARIADLLGLTGAAVRRHLEAMVAEGVLEVRDPRPDARRGRGRPAKEYVIGSAGHDDLPSGYDDLALGALRYLADTLGPQAVTDFARQRFAALEQSLAGLQGPLPDRVEALVRALADQGYSASSRPVAQGTPAEGTQLCQGHCPVQKVAEAFPQLCEAERRTFETILGTRVQRLATLAHGDHVCTTFIPLETLHQPDPAHDPQPDPAHDTQHATEGRRL
ncbi:helix-turn-helix transcriptional regulator [Kineococcus rhizosphaerae]|uniref:Putative ArsR family transcriptional regulator n=1 Tax=Kineococcus rhizosphaerae TaxID=559628 RepID=A0A2T0RA68_9ACTN|nr:crosslink repair DNA glycosylase YcaQ family protein [Kineococcus rhizosphaerae]PRY18021.1 putative ArsR family transcriptional regulator [Kineococcus rhizosphaerae]